MSDKSRYTTPKRDPDKADEGPVKAPGAMPASTFEGHRDGAKVSQNQRVRGARFLGGVWLAEDGTPLTDKEAQQAHRAMDKAAAAARAKAVLGGQE